MAKKGQQVHTAPKIGPLKVEVFKGDGKIQPWRFRVKSGNGEIVTTSEGYYSKWNAQRAAKHVFPTLPIVDA